MKIKERIKKAFNIIFNKHDDAIPMSDDNEFHDKYLFDFKKGYQSGSFTSNRLTVEPSVLDGDIEASSSDTSSNKNISPQKIAIKPIDVLNELELIPSPISLELLDEKIHILKDKEKLITQKYAKREIEALILRLENRKQYLKHKQFFDQFQNTNDEKIEKLLSKYKLVMKESDLFIPEFPDEAIIAMKEYTNIVEKICNKKPVFYVIAEDKDFQKKYEKRDPILLAQSPFGFYYSILGAWDKEMILLSEL